MIIFVQRPEPLNIMCKKLFVMILRSQWYYLIQLLNKIWGFCISYQLQKEIYWWFIYLLIDLRMIFLQLFFFIFTLTAFSFKEKIYTLQLFFSISAEVFIHVFTSSSYTHYPVLFSCTLWKLHCFTAFTVFSSFGLFSIRQQFIVILNAKEMQGPMGYGATIAPMPALIRWEKVSWYGASDGKKHPLRTPQWVQRADKAGNSSGFNCWIWFVHPSGERFLPFCQCLKSSSKFVSVQWWMEFKVSLFQ